MTSLELCARLKAKLAEMRAVCEAATPGPWRYTIRPNYQTGSAHYDVENTDYRGPCPCGGGHPPGKLVAWLAGGLGDADMVGRGHMPARHDPATEADARFIAASRAWLPACIAALEARLKRAELLLTREYVRKGATLGPELEFAAESEVRELAEHLLGEGER